MNYLIIRHRVADFAKWKPFYDAHASARAAAGLTEKELLRDISDPNFVVLLFEAKDIAKARELVESASIKKAMQEGGVLGAPEFQFLQR